MPKTGANSADFGLTFIAGRLSAQLGKGSLIDVMSNDTAMSYAVELLDQVGIQSTLLKQLNEPVKVVLEQKNVQNETKLLDCKKELNVDIKKVLVANRGEIVFKGAQPLFKAGAPPGRKGILPAGRAAALQIPGAVHEALLLHALEHAVDARRVRRLSVKHGHTGQALKNAIAVQTFFGQYRQDGGAHQPHEVFARAGAALEGAFALNREILWGCHVCVIFLAGMGQWLAFVHWIHACSVTVVPHAGQVCAAAGRRRTPRGKRRSRVYPSQRRGPCRVCPAWDWPDFASA